MKFIELLLIHIGILVLLAIGGYSAWIVYKAIVGI
jgi:hypothetical protein